MSVRHAVLGLLLEESRHAYELKRAFDQRVGDFWAVNYGQIYQTVDRLEREGLVRGNDVPQQNRPDKRIIQITDEGKDELNRWLNSPKARARPLRDEFLVKLLFSDLNRLDEIISLVQKQEEIYLEKMRSLASRKRVLERSKDKDRNFIPSLLMDAAIFHVEADLRWLEHIRLTFTEKLAQRTTVA